MPREQAAERGGSCGPCPRTWSCHDPGSQSTSAELKHYMQQAIHMLCQMGSPCDFGASFSDDLCLQEFLFFEPSSFERTCLWTWWNCRRLFFNPELAWTLTFGWKALHVGGDHRSPADELGKGLSNGDHPWHLRQSACCQYASHHTSNRPPPESLIRLALTRINKPSA